MVSPTQVTEANTWAVVQMVFNMSGQVKLCYQTANGDFTQVGSALTVLAVMPTSFSTSGILTTVSNVTVKVSGGAGLNQVQDSMKAVSDTAACNSTEGAWTVCAANEGEACSWALPCIDLTHWSMMCRRQLYLSWNSALWQEVC